MDPAVLLANIEERSQLLVERGFDDRELRGLIYKDAKGQDRSIMVRNAGTNTQGRMQTYQERLLTCRRTTVRPAIMVMAFMQAVVQEPAG